MGPWGRTRLWGLQPHLTSLWLGKSLSPGPQFAHLFSALDPEWAPRLGAEHWVLVSTVVPAHWVTVSAVWGLGFPNRAVRMVVRFQSQPPHQHCGPLGLGAAGLQFLWLQNRQEDAQ